MIPEGACALFDDAGFVDVAATAHRLEIDLPPMEKLFPNLISATQPRPRLGPTQGCHRHNVCTPGGVMRTASVRKKADWSQMRS